MTNLPAQTTQPIAPNATATSRLSRLRLICPREPLNPAAWQRALAALHSTGETLALELRAGHDSLEIVVAAEPEALPQVRRALLGNLEAVSLSAVEPPPPPAGRQLVAQLNRPAGPWAPLRAVAEFGDADPLAALLEALQPLHATETALIRFLVRPCDQRAYQGAYKEITLPQLTGSVWDLVTLVSGSGPRRPKYEARLQHRLEDRLNNPLFDVVGQVLLTGTDAARLHGRAASLASAFWAQFNAGFGGLQLEPRPQDSRTEPHLLLTAGELAAMWRAPSQVVQVPGVTFLRRPTVRLPAQLLSTNGVELGQHEYRGEQQPVTLTPHDLLQGPTVVVGRSGTGKSTAVHKLLAGLARVPGRPSIGIIDPNADLVDDYLARSVPPDREHDVVLLDLGDTSFPVNLSFFRCPRGVNLEGFVENRFGLLRTLFREGWSSSRMEDVVYALAALLCRLPNATLLDAPRVFQDPRARREAVAQLDDPVARDFWLHFEGYSDSVQRDVAAPVLHRLRALFRSPALRNMLCGPAGIDFDGLLQRGSLLLVSLGGAAIQAEADFLGEFVIASLHLALGARLGRPAAERRPLFLAIDESQRFRGGSLPILLREGRKLGLSMTLCTQYLAAWNEDLAEAVLGNSGTLICFRPGPKDARALASSLPPYTAEQLEGLDRYEAVMRMQVGGTTLPAFDLRTHSLEMPRDEALAARIRERSRQLFATPRAAVEAGLKLAPVGGRQQADLDGA